MAVSDKRPAEPPIGWTSIVARQGFHAPPAEAAAPDAGRDPGPGSKKAARPATASAFRMEAARLWPTAQLAHAGKLRPPETVRVHHVAGAAEAMALARLEQRAGVLGHHARDKVGTEALLRAGLRLLAGLDDAAFVAALHRGSRP